MVKFKLIVENLVKRRDSYYSVIGGSGKDRSDDKIWVIPFQLTLWNYKRTLSCRVHPSHSHRPFQELNKIAKDETVMVSSAFKGDQGATQYSAKSAKKGQMGSRLLTYPTQVDATLMLPMMMIVRVISKLVQIFCAYRFSIKVLSKLKLDQVHLACRTQLWNLRKYGKATIRW